MSKHVGSGPGNGRKKPPRPRRAAHIPEPDPRQWHEYGDLVISFGYVNRGGKRYPQTRAYYSQGDLFMAWEGIVKDELVEWIFEQANSFLPAAEHAAGAEEAQISPPLNIPEVETEGALKETSKENDTRDAYAQMQHPLDMEIVDLQLEEVSVPAGSRRRSVPSLRATGRLRLYHQRYQSSEIEPDEKGAGYRVELYLIPHAAPESHAQCVATQSGNFSDELAYNIEMDFPVPSAGRYRLKTVVTLLPAGTVTAQAEGPLLRVER